MIFGEEVCVGALIRTGDEVSSSSGVGMVGVVDGSPELEDEVPGAVVMSFCDDAGSAEATVDAL